MFDLLQGRFFIDQLNKIFIFWSKISKLKFDDLYCYPFELNSKIDNLLVNYENLGEKYKKSKTRQKKAIIQFRSTRLVGHNFPTFQTQSKQYISEENQNVC